VRVSSTVLWEGGGEIPLPDPMCDLNQPQGAECFEMDGGLLGQPIERPSDGPDESGDQPSKTLHLAETLVW
jgi:hypothetical protein